MLFTKREQHILIFMQEFWEQKFASEQYIYGKEPNEFFRQTIDAFQPGRIFLPGEGEGRNAVYAAQRGWKVDAVDFTNSGRNKAKKLAKEQKVRINYHIEDITTCTPNELTYDAVSLIFLHMPQKTTKELYKKLIRALKPGGFFIFQLYSKEQINYQTGGPKNEELLYSIEELADYLGDLEAIVFSQNERLIHEGDMHFGKASVIDYVGKKPPETGN